MSDTPLGDGWWIASDGKWYAPELHPDYTAPAAPIDPGAPGQASWPDEPPYQGETGAASGQNYDPEAQYLTVDQLPAIDATPEQASGSNRRGLMLGAAALVLLVGIGFLAFRLLGGGGGTGADSPEAAIQQLIDSIVETDAVGLAEIIDPDEAEGWVGSFVPAVERFQEVAPDTQQPADSYDEFFSALGDALDLSVTGPDGNDIAFAVTDLDTEHGRVARVRLDGLAIDVTAGDLGGDVMIFGQNQDQAIGLDHNRLDGAGMQVEERFGGLEFTVWVPGEERVDEFVSDAHLDLVTVQKDGKWYVSVGYTILENMRNVPDIDLGRPDFGRAYELVESGSGGADSAEAVVREFFAALEELDYQRMIALTDPLSMPYLHDYQPAIDDNVDPRDIRDTARELGLRVDTLELTTSPWNDRTFVGVTALAGRVDGTGSFSVNVTDWCAEATSSDGEFIEGCLEEAIQEALWEANQPDVNPRDLLPEAIGLVAIERNGRWFFDPLGTLGHMMEQAADVAGELDFDEMQDSDATSGFEQVFAVRGPLVRSGDSVSIPSNGSHAAAAFDLRDLPRVETFDSYLEALQIGMVRVDSDGVSRFPSSRDAAASEWVVVWQSTRSNDPVWPAVALDTDNEISVSVENLEVVRVSGSGYSGSIDADGRPQVLLFEDFGRWDFSGDAVFESGYDLQGSAITNPMYGRSSGDPSWGTFAIVSGSPGATFEVRPDDE